MNIGGNGGARLTVAEGVALPKTCAGETTKECHNNNGLLQRDEDRERERLTERERDEREPSCEEEEDTDYDGSSPCAAFSVSNL